MPAVIGESVVAHNEEILVRGNGPVKPFYHLIRHAKGLGKQFGVGANFVDYIMGFQQVQNDDVVIPVLVILYGQFRGLAFCLRILFPIPSNPFHLVVIVYIVIELLECQGGITGDGYVRIVQLGEYRWNGISSLEGGDHAEDGELFLARERSANGRSCDGIDAVLHISVCGSILEPVQIGHYRRVRCALVAKTIHH